MALGTDGSRKCIGKRSFVRFYHLKFFVSPVKTFEMWSIICNRAREIPVLQSDIRLEEQSALGRSVARLEGVTYPSGRTPRLYRWSMRDRALGASASDRLLELHLYQVIISHGEWFRSNATEEQLTRFSWLPLEPK